MVPRSRRSLILSEIHRGRIGGTCDARHSEAGTGPADRHTGGMDPRGWWTVGLTAVSGPIGAIAGATILGRVVDAAGGGMAGLAAAVGGLVLGGPIAAIVVFGVCLLTILRPLELQRAIAFAIMVAAALFNGLLVIAGLRLVSGSSFADPGILAVGMFSVAILAGGAHIAITTGDR